MKETTKRAKLARLERKLETEYAREGKRAISDRYTFDPIKACRQYGSIGGRRLA